MFTGMTAEELAAVADIAVEEGFAAGDRVYSVGDPAGGMYVVVSGAVEIVTPIVEGVERTFMTARTGDFFGWIGLISDDERAATARVIEPTKTLRLDDAPLRALEQSNPAAYSKMLDHFMVAMVRQVRDGVQSMNAAIAWSMEVSGLVHLNLADMINRSLDVAVALVDGSTLRGRIMKFESSGAGHELLLAGDDSNLHLLPYHSVVRISMARVDFPAADQTAEL